MNLLLDTNVYIDYLGRKDPFFPAAQKIMMAGFFRDAQLWLPAQSVTDAYYVLSKYVDAQNLQKAMLKSLNVIQLVSLSSEDVVSALKRSWPDLEDCLISVSAEKVKADYLVTRDIAHLEKSSVAAVEPTEMVRIFKDDMGLDYEKLEILSDAVASSTSARVRFSK